MEVDDDTRLQVSRIFSAELLKKKRKIFKDESLNCIYNLDSLSFAYPVLLLYFLV